MELVGLRVSLWKYIFTLRLSFEDADTKFLISITGRSGPVDYF